MPPPPGRVGDVCIWVVSCLFFLVIVAGGVSLVMYLTLPDSDDSLWYLVAGMSLVAIPWLFWLLTCAYRSIFHRPSTEGEGGSVATGQVGAVAVVAAVGNDSPVNSPGGGRRVRFKAATVMENERAVDGGGGGGGGGVEGKGGEEGEEGSSLTSHESELPLAFMMLS
ncbi:hypothetical protein QJS10_CPA08g01099 [Acorus calamus]|uniref:Uncharacterized protein n=1 Tax=Acorus calamus TaxID=4465 RepID=A0AAV9EDC5_ACOCL|nr:hypothetical protein QJS10_CPA08g01099 [Acorus calamus]